MQKGIQGLETFQALAVVLILIGIAVSIAETPLKIETPLGSIEFNAYERYIPIAVLGATMVIAMLLACIRRAPDILFALGIVGSIMLAPSIGMPGIGPKIMFLGSLFLAILSLVKILSLETIELGRKWVVTLSFIGIGIVGLMFLAYGCLASLPPDITMVAPEVRPARSGGWRAMGALCALLNVGAIYAIWRGSLILYLMFVGMFFSPLVLALIKYGYWAHDITFVTTSTLLTQIYVLGLIATKDSSARRLV